LALSALGCASAGLGCGAATTQSSTAPVSRTTRTTAAAPTPQAHPQVVQPVAGQVPQTGGAGGGAGGAQNLVTVTQPAHDPTPNGPASVSVAPAKGAPTDAEVRAAEAKFQAAVAQYHLDRLNLSQYVTNAALLPPGQFYTSIASVFTDYNLPIACGGVLHVAQLGVANKTLPCGTMVTFVYGGRAIRVPVLDRGPYIAGREWDLTGATAEALGFPGLGPIKWRIG
jgi:rare lipoprotein A (peptidoglycan hydrolase)